MWPRRKKQLPPRARAWKPTTKMLNLAVSSHLSPRCVPEILVGAAASSVACPLGRGVLPGLQGAPPDFPEALFGSVRRRPPEVATRKSCHHEHLRHQFDWKALLSTLQWSWLRKSRTDEKLARVVPGRASAASLSSDLRRPLLLQPRCPDYAVSVDAHLATGKPLQKQAEPVDCVVSGLVALFAGAEVDDADQGC